LNPQVLPCLDTAVFPRLFPKMQSQILLQSVQDDKAFYFYTKIGSPTGLKANSLREFAEMLKLVDSASVAFHSPRGDFEKWLMMMQDRTLASKFAAIRRQKLSPADLKTKLVKLVDLRLKQLKR
jgi:Family of unknown function (DUF5752)